jgi:hypothetical protein
MKSLFRRHYQRQEKNSAGVKHPVSSAERRTGVATVERSHAEADDTPSNSKNVPEKILSQRGSLSLLNESVTSQNGESTDILQQVVDCRSYQETQPNSAAAEHLEVSIESDSCERSNRKQSSNEGKGSSNVLEDNLPHTGRFGALIESTDNQKRHSSNILKDDNVQVIENKIFNQVQTENQDLSWRVRKDNIELYRDSASAVNRGHQRKQNAAAAVRFMKVPKQVRSGDGESKYASFLILIGYQFLSYCLYCWISVGYQFVYMYYPLNIQLQI